MMPAFDVGRFAAVLLIGVAALVWLCVMVWLSRKKPVMRHAYCGGELYLQDSDLDDEVRDWVCADCLAVVAFEEE